MPSPLRTGSPISTAATVVTVPPVPTTGRPSSRSGRLRSASSTCSWTMAMALESSSGRGGSDGSCARVREALPISSELAPAGSASPTTTSVDPPPMSTTRRDPGATPAARTPANVNRASSSGVSTRNGQPRISATRSDSASALAASRAAAVAAVATSGTPCSSISVR